MLSIPSLPGLSRGRKSVLTIPAALWYNVSSPEMQKGAEKMSNENERKDVQKAMAYDLLRIFKQEPDKSYSYEELEALIDAYISGLKQ